MEIDRYTHRAINSGELVGSKSVHQVEPTPQSRRFRACGMRTCVPAKTRRPVYVDCECVSYQNRFIPRCITTSFVDFAKKLIFLLTYDKSGTIVFIKLFDD